MRGAEANAGERGAAGERLARQFLKQKGFKILARSFTCPGGEIDLVALDGQTIVFVEVKTRADERAADIPEAVTRTKMRRLTRAAKVFLQRKDAADHPARFDLVAVLLPPGGEPVIRHTIDAFGPL